MARFSRTRVFLALMRRSGDHQASDLRALQLAGRDRLWHFLS